jgi:hypothetical protein
MNQGHPPVFSADMELIVANLCKHHNLAKVQEMLAQASHITVSRPTIAKAAKKHGVVLRRGRPPEKAA